MSEERERLIEAWFANIQMMQRAWKPRMHAELGNEQLSLGQLAVLAHVQHQGTITSKQIAAGMCMTKGAVAQFLDGLDQMGLIQRKHDPEDRRIVYISLSAAGKKKAKAMYERRKALFTKMADLMTDEELKTMIVVHEKMARQMQACSDETTKPGRQERG